MAMNIARFFRERHAATVVEYALLLAFITFAAVAVVSQLGPKLLPGFQAVIDGL